MRIAVPTILLSTFFILLLAVTPTCFAESAAKRLVGKWKSNTEKMAAAAKEAGAGSEMVEFLKKSNAHYEVELNANGKGTFGAVFGTLSKKEPIDWKVLSENDSKATVEWVFRVNGQTRKQQIVVTFPSAKTIKIGDPKAKQWFVMDRVGP